LTRLFYFCSKNIPYYQSLFKHHNVDPCAKDIWAEYAKLPYLSKDITRSEGENFVASNIKKNGLYVATTGGTTGKPVAIKFDNSSYKSEWAYKVYLWNRAIGYTPQSKKATFRGVDQLKGSLYVENPIYNEIRFSPFKLESETDLKAVVAKLKTYRPEFLHGYPSAINQLVKYLKKENISLPSVKAIILISENIFTHQTDLFRTYFSCPVYSFYGLTERVVIASMDGDDSEYFFTSWLCSN
jgi:phenylacetate-CoA ligase